MLIERLNAALPAVDRAITVAEPRVEPAVKPMIALPLASVVAVAVAVPPVNVPEPEVATWKVIVIFGIGAPRLSSARTSRSFSAAEFLTTV